jgi:hypothetical protein
VLKVSRFVVSAGKYSVTLKATSTSPSIPVTAAHSTVFNQRYRNNTADTHLITYEQTEHTMERQNKTIWLKEKNTTVSCTGRCEIKMQGEGVRGAGEWWRG